MANQLTDSEAKMLLELADKYELVSHSRDINHTALAALSELLLAAKEHGPRILEEQAKRLRAMHDRMAEIGAADLEAGARMIRTSDSWGDLFEGKS